MKYTYLRKLSVLVIGVWLVLIVVKTSQGVINYDEDTCKELANKVGFFIYNPVCAYVDEKSHISYIIPPNSEFGPVGFANMDVIVNAGLHPLPVGDLIIPPGRTRLVLGGQKAGQLLHHTGGHEGGKPITIPTDDSKVRLAKNAYVLSFGPPSLLWFSVGVFSFLVFIAVILFKILNRKNGSPEIRT